MTEGTLQESNDKKTRKKHAPRLCTPPPQRPLILSVVVPDQVRWKGGVGAGDEGQPTATIAHLRRQPPPPSAGICLQPACTSTPPPPPSAVSCLSAVPHHPPPTPPRPLHFGFRTTRTTESPRKKSLAMTRSRLTDREEAPLGYSTHISLTSSST